MMRAIKAGALYAVIVFLGGFAFGTLRVLLLAPALGEAAAVLLETPFILTASWFVCRWLVRRLAVRRTIRTRSMMGGVAFLVLMLAEFGLGLMIGRLPAEQIAAYGSLSGALGLAAQVVFALFPLVQVWRR